MVMETKRKKAKYQIVETYIIDAILSGQLKKGQQIMTESELAKKFQISRLTVHHAMQNLVNQGYIVRTAGKGSFVRTNSVLKNINQSHGSSFSEDMKNAGMIPGSKLVEYKIIQGSENPDVAELLECGPEDLIHYFVRVRTGDGVPIALSYTYISAKVIPAVSIDALNHSLSSYLKSLGIEATMFIYKMTATLPTPEQAKLLGVDNVALFKNCHISYMDNRVPYEYIETLYISDRFEYTFVKEIT
jgi:GntR family transcriptional regulator